MPHLIIEHSSDIKKSSIKSLEQGLQDVMAAITEGNFDPDQCKARSFSFDEYLVGKPDQSTSSFLHITIKILSGRLLEVRKKLAQNSVEFANQFISKANLNTARCDISVDIVEMDKETYQKVRVGS